MADYYVATTGNDSAAGTIGAPFLTIGKGLSVAFAGDTVHVRGGTYTVKISTVRAGTNAGSPVTLKAYTGETVVIDGAGLASSNYDNLVSVWHNHNVIDGFELKNFNTSFTYAGGYGVWIDPGTDGVILRNCIVHEIADGGIICAGQNAIVEYNTVYRACLNQTTTPQPMTAANWASGLQIQTPGYSPYNNIANIRTGMICRYNTVYNIYGEGIMAMRVRNCQVYGNTVYNCGAVHLYITDSDHMEVYNNLVYAIASDCHTLYPNRGAGRGIAVSQEYAYNAAANSTYINVYNNVVIGTAHPFIYFVTNLGSPKFENSVVAYNVFMDGTQDSGGYGNGATTINFTAGGISNVAFRNNVITQIDSAYAIFAATTLTGLTFDHNIWGKTPTGLTIDGTSVVQDPQISRNGTVAAGVLTTEYFRPNSGSWVFDHGTPVSGITVDIFGTARDGTLPTVGAIEDTTTIWGALPPPWLFSDVGSPSPAGTGEYATSLDQYRIVSNNTVDVWGATDQLSAIYQVLPDVPWTLTYKIESYTGSATYFKVGADFRTSLTASASNIAMFLLPNGGGTQITRRYPDGATTTSSLLFLPGVYDRWHKISKPNADSSATFSTSPDGVNWTDHYNINTPPINSNTTHICMAVCAQSASMSASGIFSNVTFSYGLNSTGTIQADSELLGNAQNAEISQATGTIAADTTIAGNSRTSEILQATGTITVDTTLAGVSNGGDDGDMATAQDIIRSALLLNGAVAADQTISATDLDDGLVTLNNMIESWGIDRNVVYTTPTISAATVAGTDNVTLGTRPVRILSAYIRDAAAIDHTIEEVGEDDFSIIANKSTTSDFPLVFWCDYNNPTPTVKFWPIPAKAYTVYFVIHAPFTGFAELNTTVVFPPGYERALRYNLAVEMAQYSAALPPKVEEIAREALMLIKVANHRPRTVQLDPTFCGRAGRTNIYSNIT